ncbi:MCE-family protein, partial [Mycobacterium sp. ITM-2017-0098]
IQVGKVESIEYAGSGAKLTLAINRSDMRYIPADAPVRIGGTTSFGAKGVEFLAPESWDGRSLSAGDEVKAEDVQLEVNTLFQTLT